MATGAGPETLKSNSSPPNYKHTAVLEMVDRMDRELAALREQFIKLSVSSSLLEVDLATLFDPEEVLQVDRLEETCCQCTQAIQETSQIVITLIQDINTDAPETIQMATEANA